jgi:hypothetical protein
MNVRPRPAETAPHRSVTASVCVGMATRLADRVMAACRPAVLGTQNTLTIDYVRRASRHRSVNCDQRETRTQRGSNSALKPPRNRSRVVRISIDTALSSFSRVGSSNCTLDFRRTQSPLTFRERAWKIFILYFCFPHRQSVGRAARGHVSCHGVTSLPVVSGEISFTFLLTSAVASRRRAPKAYNYCQLLPVLHAGVITGQSRYLYLHVRADRCVVGYRPVNHRLNFSWLS